MNSREFLRLREFIEAETGLLLREEKSFLFESALKRLLLQEGESDLKEFCRRIFIEKDSRLSQRLIDETTIHETYWFRDRYPWAILKENALPELMEKLRLGVQEEVWIWSAACSYGQEAYSILFAIDQYLKENGIFDVSIERFRILGTDISSSVLDVAREGIYDEISIGRGLPAQWREYYFMQGQKGWKLKSRFLGRVDFIHWNLCKEFSMEELRSKEEFTGKFDIVFCRNVLIYFSDWNKRKAFENVCQAMHPDSILILGAGELLSDYNELLTRNEHLDGVFYRKK